MTKNIERLHILMQAALERYSHEEIFEALLNNIKGYKERRKLSEIIVSDEYLMDEITFTAKYSNKVSAESIDNMKGALELKGYECIDCSSLAVQLKVEQFKSEIEQNPYQLQLIA